MTPTSPWLLPADAAEYLGVAVDTIRRWTKEGSLSCFVTPGGQRRYRQADLDALLVANQRQDTEPTDAA